MVFKGQSSFLTFYNIKYSPVANAGYLDIDFNGKLNLNDFRLNPSHEAVYIYIYKKNQHSIP